MAVTSAAIQARLEGLGYPCFTADALAAIIANAEAELSAYKPKMAFAQFSTIYHQNEYYIWDIDAPEYVAGAVDALAVYDLWWNPSGDSSVVSVFSPGYEIMNNLIVFNGSWFHRPSDVVMLQQKLNSWATAYGAQGFDVVGEPGNEESYIRIHPIPGQDDIAVVVQICLPYTLADINSLASGQGRYLMQWIEAFAAASAANEASKTAGVNLGPFKTSDSSLKHWKKVAEEKRQFALDQQGGLQGQAERT